MPSPPALPLLEKSAIRTAKIISNHAHEKDSGDSYYTRARARAEDLLTSQMEWNNYN